MHHIQTDTMLVSDKHLLFLLLPSGERYTRNRKCAPQYTQIVNICCYIEVALFIMDLVDLKAWDLIVRVINPPIISEAP